MVSMKGTCVITATTISAGYNNERRCLPGDGGALRNPDRRPDTLCTPGILSLTVTWQNLPHFVGCVDHAKDSPHPRSSDTLPAWRPRAPLVAPAPPCRRCSSGRRARPRASVPPRPRVAETRGCLCTGYPCTGRDPWSGARGPHLRWTGSLSLPGVFFVLCALVGGPARAGRNPYPSQLLSDQVDVLLAARPLEELEGRVLFPAGGLYGQSPRP